MKAKYFKRIREKCSMYDVQKTSSLFGNFERGSYKYVIKVLAKNHVNACERAKRRGYGRDLDVSSYEKAEMWAKWKVKKSNEADHWRNIKFF